MTVKFGIIGTNFISDEFCGALAQIPGAEPCAVYSRRQETGAAFASRHKIPQVYTDYEDFLDSGPDAVYVASPNAVHCRQTLQALRRKIHVLCEKIMAVNSQEADAMIHCALENNVILLEAMRPDFDPAYDLITAALPRIGKVRRACFEYCQYSSRYDSFREGVIQNAFNPRLGNAAVMDIGVYCIHSLIRLFGMPRGIRCLSTKLENGFEGSGTVLMEYDGMAAEAVYSKITASVNPSVIQGEDGTITLDSVSRPRHVQLYLREGAHRTPHSAAEELPLHPAQNNMIYEIMEFLRLIDQKQTDHKYLQYSLDTLRVIDEVRRQSEILF